MKYSKYSAYAMSIFAIAAFAAFVVGWVMNLVKIYLSLSSGAIDPAVSDVLRAAGVFVAPLGAVLGWL